MRLNVLSGQRAHVRALWYRMQWAGREYITKKNSDTWHGALTAGTRRPQDGNRAIPRPGQAALVVRWARDLICVLTVSWNKRRSG